MNQSEAEQVYLHHLNRTEMLINSMGDNPQAINALAMGIVDEEQQTV